MARFKRLPGEPSCPCNCRPCSFGYHCSPCAKAHLAAKRRRHFRAYRASKQREEVRQYPGGYSPVTLLSARPDPPDPTGPLVDYEVIPLTETISLYHEFEGLLRPYVVGSVSGVWPHGLLRVPVDPLEYGIDGHIRADTLPGGAAPLGSSPREFRRRLLDRAEDLMDMLAARQWYPCHATMRQEFTTHYGSPRCTFGNEVVKPAPQFNIALAISVQFRKFAEPS